MAIRRRWAFRNILLSLGIVSLWLTWGASLPWADTLLPDEDPLFIGDGVGGICPQGGTSAGTFPPSGAPGSGACWVFDPSKASTPPTLTPGGPYNFTEVNELTTAGKLDIFKNGSSFDPLKNPILLIFAIPNVNLLSGAAETAALTSASVTDASLYHPLTPNPVITPLSVSFGTTAYGLTGYSQGSLLGPGQEIYSFLGLPPPGVSTGLPNSNSFTNWNSADWNIPQQLIGFVPFDSITGYKIYIYGIFSSTSKTPIPLYGGDAIDVSFLSCPPPFTSCGNSLPIGSFVVAYGQGPKKDGTGALGTPFTQAAIQMPPGGPPPPPQLPEPASLLLLGSGLAFVGKLWQKRQGRNN